MFCKDPMYCLDNAHVILRFKIGDACVATLLLLLVMVPGLLQLLKLVRNIKLH